MINHQLGFHAGYQNATFSVTSEKWEADTVILLSFSLCNYDVAIKTAVTQDPKAKSVEANFNISYVMLKIMLLHLPSIN